MTPDARRDSLLDELRQRHAGLSPRLQQAARHVLDHPNQAALSTVTELSAAAGVQPSTLIRLAQALGFPGFSDMQKVLVDALATASSSYGERVHQLRAAGAGEGATGLLRQAGELNQISLQNLIDTVDPAALDRAVAILAAAPLVHVVGQRRSHPVAGYIAYGLTRSGKAARLLSGAAGMLRDEVETMRPGDALVVISLHPYSEEAINAAAWASAHGVSVVALSDGPLSPLLASASVSLDVRDAELFGFRSLVAQMCLAQVLVLGALQAP
ncbi:MurR/RpiR family transcriptional regulator [Pararoseomonas indoligenes]|uniref:MurR/RpiR family transcriptional regulator n=1 Tax=Roseomonas indoligenes TaxID=2820811 RepID=A0A940MWH2_9PROT|nr:MurR/RpiR family transcriptional regulator [Pararoseomonas indoligenes]MBP0495498.1 MurR/RpiR family transcriptional regulator [Pararoseomonas indoligenes]